MIFALVAFSSHSHLELHPAFSTLTVHHHPYSITKPITTLSPDLTIIPFQLLINVPVFQEEKDCTGPCATFLIEILFLPL